MNARQLFIMAIIEFLIDEYGHPDTLGQLTIEDLIKSLRIKLENVE